MKTIYEMESDSYNRAIDEDLKVEKLTEDQYLVINFEHQSIYHVDTDNEKVLSCDCAHYTYRNIICKHMMKVSIETGKQI